MPLLDPAVRFAISPASRHAQPLWQQLACFGKGQPNHPSAWVRQGNQQVAEPGAPEINRGVSGKKPRTGEATPIMLLGESIMRIRRARGKGSAAACRRIVLRRFSACCAGPQQRTGGTARV